MTEVSSIPEATKREMALFDWWILNGDRTLSESGGNPNILWAAPDLGPYVIDHNLAFDESVTLSSLERDHIFGSSLREIVDTERLRHAFAERLNVCLTHWEDIWREVPDRWYFLDDLRTMETAFSKERALALLRRCESAEMWTRP